MGARAKEAIICVLDVSESMNIPLSSEKGKTESRLDVAKSALEMLIQQKLMYSKRDEVGIVLFGSEETQNQLNDEMGGDEYSNVQVLQEIDAPTVDMYKAVSSISPGNVKGDVLNGIIVALDLLHRRTANKKYQKRMFLITDAASPITGVDSLDPILQQLKSLECELNIIGVDFTTTEANTEAVADAETQDEASTIKRENERMLVSLLNFVEGNILPVNRAIELLSQLKSRSVLQVTKFRGNLEIGSACQIPVYVYAKTTEMRLPSLKKESQVSDRGAVKMDRLYKNPDRPNELIGPEERAKGFRFGRQIVPFSAADEQTAKYHSERCLQLLGFVPRDEIPRHHFTSGTDLLVSEPGKMNAAIAISALAHALTKDNCVGIARYVPRANSDPRMAVLLPYLTPAFEGLLINSLPLMEDFRGYKFPSFDQQSKLFPSKAQSVAAERLVLGLDLSVAESEAKDKTEDVKPTAALKSEEVFNPTLHRFYQTLRIKALSPTAVLPPVDRNIEKFSSLHEKMVRTAAQALGNFSDVFPLKAVEKKKGKKRFWSEREEEGGLSSASGQQNAVASSNKPADAEEVEDEDEEEDLDVSNLLGGLQAITSVGTVNPVRDFEHLLKKTQSQDQAIKEMKEVIEKFMTMGDLYFGKALQCLASLRKGSLKIGRSAEFNQFLTDIKGRCVTDGPAQFWGMIVDSAITLIHSHEDSSIDVSMSTANEEASQVPSQSQVIAVEENDELFDEME